MRVVVLHVSCTMLAGEATFRGLEELRLTPRSFSTHQKGLIEFFYLNNETTHQVWVLRSWSQHRTEFVTFE